MDQIANTLGELNLDMGTLTGRLRWALFILGVLDSTDCREHPIQPQTLAGYESLDIKKLMKKSRLSEEELRTLRAFRQWRDEVLQVEGINALSINGGLRAVQIFDEVLESELAVNRDDVTLKRETTIYLLHNKFGVVSEEHQVAFANPAMFAKKKSQDFAAFNHWWRDPLSPN